MLKINDNVRIKSFDYSYSDFDNQLISIYLNTRNTIISSPRILLVLAGLNGVMTKIEWLDWTTRILNISQRSTQDIIDEFAGWNILLDVENPPYSNLPISHIDFLAQNQAQTILIDDINFVTEYIVCFLHMFGLENVHFSKDVIINEKLTINSLLFSCQDVGESFVETLKSKLQSDSITLTSTINKFSIVIDPTSNYLCNENLSFSTPHYANIKNFGECNVFDEVKHSSMMIDNICNALHLVEDILYSIHNGTVI